MMPSFRLAWRSQGLRFKPVCTGRKKLPGLDSNQENQDQNLVCYHYTTG